VGVATGVPARTDQFACSLAPLWKLLETGCRSTGDWAAQWSLVAEPGLWGARGTDLEAVWRGCCCCCCCWVCSPELRVGLKCALAFEVALEFGFEFGFEFEFEFEAEAEALEKFLFQRSEVFLILNNQVCFGLGARLRLVSGTQFETESCMKFMEI